MTYRVVMDCVDVDLLTMCQVTHPVLLPAARATPTTVYKAVIAYSLRS